MIVSPKHSSISIGLMFVRFPSSSSSGGTENSSETSVDGEEGAEEGTPMAQER